MMSDAESREEMNQKINQLEIHLREAQNNYRHVRKALEFYASFDNWYSGDSFKQSCRINENDLEYFPTGKLPI